MTHARITYALAALALALLACISGGEVVDAPATGEPPTPAPTSVPTAGLGETLEAEGYALAALQVEDPAPPGILYTPEEGTRLVAVEVIVGNVDAEMFTANPLYATLIDAEGFTYQAELAGRDGQLDVVELNSGQKARGWVAYQIPDGATPALLDYRFEMYPSITLRVRLTE